MAGAPLRSGHFIASLVAAAKKRPVRIVLPEGAHPGILAAAARAQSEGVADCVVLGEPQKIMNCAAAAGIVLPAALTIQPPPLAALTPSLAVLRAHKGMDEKQAAELLKTDAVAAAAMMVRENYAAGMVAGAATATAKVLRRVLQIVGTAADAPLASSCFLMDMPQGAMIFADCALNVRPAPEQLAAIALQSANSARRFGLVPAVAMLSYATGDSASGDEVERIKKATALAKQQMPEVPVCGPIQYDAAVSPAVAAVKAPQWEAGGRANVLIFPDLSSGNIGYKAVQQAAEVIAVGPLLQGLAAPANDLSRGATVDDIYCTIAATVLQAGVS